MGEVQPPLFSVATNFDDALPAALAGLGVRELFGACDDTGLGHGRPREIVPPVSWRQLGRHVAACQRHDIRFNLLLNPLCLGALEGSTALERRLRRTLRRAVDLGVTDVTVGHPWVLELATEYPLEARVSVFVGISTVEQALHWEQAGAHVLALDTHVLCRDLRTLEAITSACSIPVEVPVNIGCLLRCPLARTHAARLSHSSMPGAQPKDACVEWCMGEKQDDPVNVVRADFIRPEDLGRYQEVGIHRFKLVDRSCSTTALVTRVRAYSERRWQGDLLELIGPRGRPPRQRLPPVWTALRRLGLSRSLEAARQLDELMRPTISWVLDNQQLDDLLLPRGCQATHCEACGHCAQVAARAVRPRSPSG